MIKPKARIRFTPAMAADNIQRVLNDKPKAVRIANSGKPAIRGPASKQLHEWETRHPEQIMGYYTDKVSYDQLLLDAKTTFDILGVKDYRLR